MSTLEKREESERIKEYFRSQLKQRINQTGMTITEISHRSGISRSVINGYLKADVNMPTSLNLISLSNALGIAPSHLLLSPHAMTDTDQLLSTVNLGATCSLSGHLSEFLQIFEAYQDHYVYYLPKSLPEPLKTPAILRAEFGQTPIEEVKEYLDLFDHAAKLKFSGTILLDERQLEDVATRSSKYSHLSEREVRDQLLLLVKFAEKSYPRLQLKVIGFSQERLSDCIVLGDDLMAQSCFDRIIYIPKGPIITHFLKRINKASQRATDFQYWVEKRGAELT